MNRKDALKNTKWRVAATSATSYIDLSESLQTLGQVHADKGEKDEAEVLGLLSSVCLMMFSCTNSTNEPYTPLWTMNGRSSATLGYFENEGILNFFNDIFPLLNKCPLLKARIGDVLWILAPKKEFKHAQGAIKAYMSLPIDQSSWYGNNDQAWQRAITFTKKLGNGGKSHLIKIEVAFYDAFTKASKSHRKFTQRLADLMLMEGFSENHSETIAKTLDRHAKKLSQQNEFNWAQEGFRLAAEWHERAGNHLESFKAEVAIADTLVLEADFKRDSGTNGILVSGELYDRALQLYRNIPNELRGKLRLNKKIQNASLEKEATNKQAVGLMRPHEIEAIDYRRVHLFAKQLVQSENPLQCLRNLTAINSGFDIDNFENEIRTKKRGFFRSMFSSTQMTDTGQIAAKAPSIGLDPLDPETEEYKKWMSFQLHQRYQIMVNLHVSGIVMPALWEMHQTKRLTERFFVNLAYWSPTIPEGREYLVGKALYCGYELDFSTAIHILSPQIENIVRTHLKQSLVNTRHTDRNGIDTEKGLSSLTGKDVPEFESIFGRDIAAEIRMLFCEGTGPNLRNNVAHGLLDDSSSNSPFSIYAWWFLLKILFRSFQKENEDA